MPYITGQPRSARGPRRAAPGTRVRDRDDVPRRSEPAGGQAQHRRAGSTCRSTAPAG